MLQHSTLDDIAYNTRHSHPIYTNTNSKRRRSSQSRHGRRRSTSSLKRKNFATHQCAVCLDDSSTLDTKLFPCGHTFHGQCLIQWVTVQKGRKFNCPLCRQDIANFIHMTGNQQINEQLIAIWNDQYLFNSSSNATTMDTEKSSSNAKSIGVDLKTTKTGEQEPESLTAKVVEPVRVKSVEFESPTELQCACDHHEKPEPKPLTMDPPSTTDTEQVNGQQSVRQSMWKFIWKNPVILYMSRPKSTTLSYSSRAAMLSCSSSTSLHAITEHDVSYEDTQDEPLQADHDQFQWQPFQPVPPQKPTPALLVDHDDGVESEEAAQPRLLHKSQNEPADNNLDLLPFTALNLRSGLMAGFCAGSTTFALTQQFRYHFNLSISTKGAMLSTVRSSMLPILCETVPSVAVFFTSYEHCKRYLCHIDTEKHSSLYTFGQRFVSAGIASSLAYFAPNPCGAGRALLPLRFATFFGTFELCKDAMNKRHDELNVAQVATAAAVGGSIAHSLYYPLLQLQRAGNVKVVNVSTSSLPSLVSSVVAEGGNIGRSVYRGCVSSWSKFLPSCVVCSCAFEYSKRYLSE